MTDQAIEKKKRRRRSARLYDNPAKVTPEQLAAHLALLEEGFPPDDDDDALTPAHAEASARNRAMAAKRDIGTAEREQLASEGRAVRNADGHVSYPVRSHSDAENALALIRSGHGDTAAAKRMLRRVAREEGWSDILDGLKGKKAEKHIGASADGRSYAEARVSPPILAGHQSPAAGGGDHGAAMGGRDPMAPSGPRSLALGHPDMRFGSTTAVPWYTGRIVNGDDQCADRDLIFAAGRVSTSIVDAAAAAGAAGPLHPSANPAARWPDHIARDSATPANGSHWLDEPCSHAGAPGAMKASEARAIMKDYLFGPGGRR